MQNLTVNNLTVSGAITFSDNTTQHTSYASNVENTSGIFRDITSNITSFNIDDVIVEKNLNINQQLNTSTVRTNAVQFMNDLDVEGVPIIQTAGFSNNLKQKILESSVQLQDIVPDILEPPLKKAKLNIAEFVTEDYATSINDFSIVQESLIENSRTQIEPNSIQLRNSLANTGSIFLSNDLLSELNFISSTGRINFNTNDLYSVGQIWGQLIGTSSDTEKIRCTADNSDGTYYLPFLKTPLAQSKELFMDTSLNPLTYNPFSSTLSATNFNGLASNCTNVLFTSDNANATHYIPFVKTNATGQKPLFIDDFNPPLSYNPFTGSLTCALFAGTATNATNISCTRDDTSGTYFIPFVKTGNTGNKSCFIDDVTGPLTYNPASSTLTATTIAGNLSGTATNAQNVNVVATNATNTTYCVNFSSASGNTNIRSDSNFTFNPFTDLLAIPGDMTCRSVIADVGINTPYIVYPDGNARIQALSDTGVLDLTGNNFTTTSSGSNSGQHLRVRINGVNYVINLLNP